MSLLYLGTHSETKEPAIIKVLSPKYLTNPDVIRRFLKEAEIIAMADHPNIVKIYGRGEWEGGLYIAIEFIPGVSLRQYLLQNPISLRKALEIIIDIAYALCHLHTHGVIHRDLKPENILITETGQVKVIDFGIAQLLTEPTSLDERTRQRLIGTPVYMSPEQRENPESVSFPSDIYSLGIISYELLMGKLSHGQIHLALMPKGMQKILNKALQPNSKDRYQDLVDFISDVSGYLHSPHLEKDKKAGDQISEIADNLKKAQAVLVSEHIPGWTDCEIGIASSKNINVTGIYLDFFDLPEGLQGIILAESATHDAEGLIHTAMLRGMVRSLCMLTNRPVEIMTVLNDLLLRDSIPHIFNVDYLILDKGKDNCSFISCGDSKLWKIAQGEASPKKVECKNNALGTDLKASFQEMQFPWETGDRLILGFDGAQFEKLLEENRALPPQKQADAILREAKLSPSKFPPERPLVIVSILRK